MLGSSVVSCTATFDQSVQDSRHEEMIFQGSKAGEIAGWWLIGGQ